MQNSITLLGHTLGFISVALFFYSYQRTQKSKIMLIQTAATALSCVQYLLIGATSGFALNVVCIIRNFAFYYREKNNKTDLVTPAFFCSSYGSSKLLLMGRRSLASYNSRSCC